MDLTRIYRRTASLAPGALVQHIEKGLMASGIRGDAREVAGKWFIIYLFYGAAAFVVYAAVRLLSGERWTMDSTIAGLDFFLLGVVVAAVILELSMYYSMRNRSTAMEKVLPDFLLLMASNLRAGMTPFMAFVKAARPEFGALSDEVLYAASNLSGSASLNEAMDELAKRFESPMLTRVVVFFKKGVHSGGKLASLLVSSAEEIRRIYDLRAELQTTTRTYTIFLGFVVIIIMPFLLSISTQFVMMFLSIREQTIGASAAISRTIPMFSGEILVTPDEMMTASYVSLVITSMLVSALSGVISSGRPLDGVKYFPLLAIASAIMFIVSRFLVSAMLAGFM